MKSIDYTEIYQDLEKYDQNQIQGVLAGKLREIAMNNLEQGDGPVAKAFRGEYFPIYQTDDYKSYIDKQKTDGSWGTDVDAISLAEALDCHLVVTSTKDNKTSEPYCLYRSSNPDAPIVYLCNHETQHWSAKGLSTKGDGNCLYNAFAQALQQDLHLNQNEVSILQNQPESVSKQNAKLTQTVLPAEKVQPSMQHIWNNPWIKSCDHEQNIEITRANKSLVDAISEAPTPEQMKTALLKEMHRIAALPENTKKQIYDDYKLSLQIADDEKRSPSFRR